MEPPRRVADDLVDHALGRFNERDALSWRAWRGVDIKPLGGAQRMNPKQVGAVTDYDDALQVVCPSDYRQPARRLLSICALGFGNNLAFWNATGQQVVVPHTALGVRFVSSAA